MESRNKKFSLSQHKNMNRDEAKHEAICKNEFLLCSHNDIFLLLKSISVESKLHVMEWNGIYKLKNLKECHTKKPAIYNIFNFNHFRSNRIIWKNIQNE